MNPTESEAEDAASGVNEVGARRADDPALVASPKRLNVVLHQPEIAPNVGAIGRTCVALDARLWLVRPWGFQIAEKRLRRAGLDYWPKLDWVDAASWEETAEALGGTRFWFFTKTATRTLYDVSFEEGDALVFGSESRGLPPSLLERFAGQLVRIPISENVRSLNLSCAVAVAGYEALRQIDRGAAGLKGPER
jgi:tRNA (cytidine/uridine-2'-O-)-methyltransferase